MLEKYQKLWVQNVDNYLPFPAKPSENLETFKEMIKNCKCKICSETRSLSGFKKRILRYSYIFISVRVRKY